MKQTFELIENIKRIETEIRSILIMLLLLITVTHHRKKNTVSLMKSKLDLLKRKIMSPLHSSTISIHLFLLIIFIYALVCFTKPEKIGFLA